MSKKFTSLIMLLFLIPSVVFSTGFSDCSVCVLNESNIELKKYYSSRNITNALKLSLEYTKENASQDNLLKIKITKGSFYVSETLHLTSYTTIDLGHSTLVNANTKRGNIFKSPEDEPYPRYSSLTECIIENGSLDDNYNHNKSCILRLCHSENVTIRNVKFLNNYYSHHAELAGCRNIRFENCLFYGQVSDLNVSSSEAIQIDILDKVHFYGFTCYDNTMNNNIVISYCTFRNVYRGVGTHNYFKNLYQQNIEISDCTFENITDCAISAVNFSNVNFKNNKYKNCKYSVFSRNNGK